MASLYQTLADPTTKEACAAGARLIASLELSPDEWEPGLAELLRRLVVGAQNPALREEVRDRLFPAEQGLVFSREVQRILQDVLFTVSCEDITDAVTQYRGQPGGMSEEEAVELYRKFCRLSSGQQALVITALESQPLSPLALDSTAMEGLLESMKQAPNSDTTSWM